MAVERQAPDVLLASLEVTGALADIDEDPDSPDANWLVATGNDVNTEARVSFPTPTGPPTVGADLQEFRAYVRQFDTGQTGTPQCRIELWENGALVRAGADVNITGAGQILSFTWNANELATADGSQVEAKLVGTKSGGGPSARNTVDFGAIEWNVSYNAPTLQTGAYGDGAGDWLDAMTLAGASGTQVAGFTFLKPDSGITEGRWFQAFEGRALMRINGESGGKYKANIIFLTSALGTVLDVETDYVITPAAWNLILLSYDSATQTLHLRDQNGDIENTGYGGRQLNTGTIDLDVEFSVFAAVNGAFKFPGALGPFLFTNEAVDWSVQANVDKVIDGDGYPNLAVLGADGSGLTGTQPPIWLRADYANFHTNYGSGGDFTVNGALDDDLTLPQVSGGAAIAGNIPISVTLAASMAAGRSIAGDIPVQITPAADMAEGRAFAGDLPIQVTPAADMSVGRSLAGDLPILVTPAADMAEGRSIIGDLPIGVTLAGDMAEGRAIAGDIPVGVTMAAVMAGPGAGGAIAGDLPILLTPAADMAAGRSIIGDLPVGVTLAGDMAEGRAFAGDLPISVTPAAAMAVGRSFGGAVTVETLLAAALAEGRAFDGALAVEVTLAALMTGGAPPAVALLALSAEAATLATLSAGEVTAALLAAGEVTRIATEMEPLP